MSKVLGDDPFAPPPPAAGAPDADAHTDTDTDADADAAAATTELAPDAVPPDEALDDIFYGEETSPPPDDWGPGLDARKEIPYTRSITDEVREIERRVRARLSPAFPIEQRRKLPFELVWKRWRDLAMRDRSDAVDEFGRDPLYAARVDPILEFLYTRYFRVDAQGLENIPEHGRAILVANHSGTLPYDGAMLMYAVRRDAPSHRDVRP
ncbi:MAG TPA: hypothetical protein VKE69_06340, partial [Planctomycetota bacterium]|nr:hypothetical protein [Planctomycetota bacterium]